MKIKNLYIYALFTFTGVISACVGGNKSDVQIENSDSISNTVESSEVVPDEIQLDNGKKWKVDEEMMVYIRTIERELMNFSNGALADMGDYTALSESVSLSLDSLTSNCTMNGQAHDELHKWLLPFLDNSKEFASAESSSDASLVYEKMKDSFQEFNRCFE